MRRNYAEITARNRELEERVAALERDMKAVLQRLSSGVELVREYAEYVPERVYDEYVPQKDEDDDRDDSNRNVKVGNILPFGKDPVSRKTIEWIVLSVRAGHALLISENAIEYRPLCDVSVPAMADAWEASTLRGWLNGKFYDGAFSVREKSKILPVDISGDNYEKPTTPSGDGTGDKAFLLSAADYRKYSDTLKSSKEDLSYAMDYAAGGTPWWDWWLRSSGTAAGTAMCVDSASGIAAVKDPAMHVLGIRPAIFVNIRDAGGE